MSSRLSTMPTVQVPSSAPASTGASGWRRARPSSSRPNASTVSARNATSPTQPCSNSRCTTTFLACQGRWLRSLEKNQRAPPCAKPPLWISWRPCASVSTISLTSIGCADDSVASEKTVKRGSPHPSPGSAPPPSGSVIVCQAPALAGTLRWAVWQMSVYSRCLRQTSVHSSVASALRSVRRTTGRPAGRSMRCDKRSSSPQPCTWVPAISRATLRWPVPPLWAPPGLPGSAPSGSIQRRSPGRVPGSALMA